MSDTIITVENLSKRYKLGTIGATTLRDSVERAWHRLRGKDWREEMGKIGHAAKPRPIETLDIRPSTLGQGEKGKPLDSRPETIDQEGKGKTLGHRHWTFDSGEGDGGEASSECLKSIVHSLKSDSDVQSP